MPILFSFKKLVNIYNIKLFLKKNNVLVVDLVMVLEARPLRMITEFILKHLCVLSCIKTHHTECLVFILL